MLVTLVLRKFLFKNNFFFINSPSNSFLFLRKARLFVKSRYSRNRQWSKAIVYFGLWFNIISVLWTIYYCYRYMFIFSNLFWLLLAVALVSSFRVAQMSKPSAVVTWVRSISLRS